MLTAEQIEALNVDMRAIAQSIFKAVDDVGGDSDFIDVLIVTENVAAMVLVLLGERQCAVHCWRH